ncbi:MAG: hypothetical protein NTZ16_12470 [Verrucomicrobia bacterium]|nr:hypothetical protein [Verrucomicrobiota bacterium]
MNAATLQSYWRVYLAVLICRLGGVAGAVRRIVFAWPGEFSTRQIENSLRQLYPGLHPNEHQVADVIERMRRQQLIEVVAEDAGGQVFRRCERRAFTIIPEVNPQLTLCL